ncbi:DoxX family membrane protein [Candidatus Woesearchaeota archaeon]|nr:DoxX family membrane protein [Candidatus Woesearchaeota archaeon]
MKVNFGKLVLKVSLALLLLWFGISQVSDAKSWLGWISPSVERLIPFDLGTFVLINGSFEIILGLVLLLGFFPKLASLITFLHIFGIALSLGYNDIAIRDFALALSALALFFLEGEKGFEQEKFKKLSKLLYRH